MTLSAFAGGTLFGRRHGTGPAHVLALHGWSRNHSDFDQSLQGFDAIALDLHGFGATPAPDSVWGAREYAEAIGPAIDDMALPIIVVGHSFGGRVAVHLAQQRPAAVAGLVLTGVPLLHRSAKTTKSPLRFRIGKRLHKLGLVPDARMEELRKRYGSADYRAASGVMRDVLVRLVNESYEAQLASIGCPVDLVWGDDDMAAPAEIATRAETMLHDARLTIVANTDHFLPISHPDVIRNAIRSQIDRLQ
ncbi:MAG: alpha/beta hydrolase [Actinomycetia bacterium]|nr:alpha/beta hydrolase [Actinomycetes bacterium]